MTARVQTYWDLPSLLRLVPGRKFFHCPLARYTSFRIGGPADALIVIEEVRALKQVQALAQAHHIPLFILGAGSNLLIRDGGVRGIVVMLHGTFRTYRVIPCRVSSAPATAIVQAGGGYPLSRLARQLAGQGWSGLEFAYGIPGTLGGAMVMNAGTHLGDLRQVLVAAHVLLVDGRERELPVAALGLRYRGSSYPPGAIVLAGRLRVQQREPDDITTVMYEAYRYRQRTQPLWLPNAGSIFKNPPGMAAARMIEALGLKGTRLGGAMISRQHANFIVNVERATATEVEALIRLVRERVQKVYGIMLALEIQVIGEAP